MPGQDGELRKAFQRTLGKQGLKFKLNTKVKEAKTEGNVVKLRVEPSKGGDEETIEADIVLLSAGEGLPHYAGPEKLL